MRRRHIAEPPRARGWPLAGAAALARGAGQGVARAGRRASRAARGEKSCRAGPRPRCRAATRVSSPTSPTAAVPSSGRPPAAARAAASRRCSRVPPAARTQAPVQATRPAPLGTPLRELREPREVRVGVDEAAQEHALGPLFGRARRTGDAELGARGPRRARCRRRRWPRRRRAARRARRGTRGQTAGALTIRIAAWPWSRQAASRSGRMLRRRGSKPARRMYRSMSSADSA